MRRFLLFPLVSVMLAVASASGAAAVSAEVPRPADPQRIAEIAARLPERPAWPIVHVRPDPQLLPSCRRKALPDCGEACYLGFHRTGSRSPYQENIAWRNLCLRQCAAAVAKSGDTKALVRALTIVRELCEAKSWTYPAHDKDLSVFSGREVRIDLGVSENARDLAETVSLLGARLPEDLVRRIRDEIERRAFSVYRQLRDQRRTDELPLRRHGWFYGHSNWAAVCHGNLALAALTLVEDKTDRAAFLEAAERGMSFFLTGFGEDGYCSEGVSYWNLGFGHFLEFALAARNATGGLVDYGPSEPARRAMAFAFKYRLDDLHCPAFADGGGDTRRPHDEFVKMGCALWPAFESVRRRGLAPRDLFPEAMVYVGRTPRLCLGIKGGTNGELHNHNDIGSWTLVADGVEIAGDPGRGEYTAQTFGPNRYKAWSINSFGHPVPRVDGHAQGAGKRYFGRIVATNFTERADRLVLDLTGAYAGLDRKTFSLVRTAELRRTEPEVVLADELKAEREMTFESAFVTSGEVVRGTEGTSFSVTKREGGRAVRVGVAVEVRPQELRWHLEDRDVGELRKRPFRRLAVVLDEPVRTATVAWRIRPLDGPEETPKNERK